MTKTMATSAMLKAIGMKLLVPLKWIFAIFGKFPRGAIAITIVLVLLGGAIIDAYEARNASVFVVQLVETFSVDERAESIIQDLRVEATNNGGTVPWKSLVFPLFKIFGLYYLLYYLYFLFEKLWIFGSSNKSEGGLKVMIAFLVLFYVLQILATLTVAEIKEDPRSLIDGRIYLDSFPLRGIWGSDGLIQNYDLWFATVRDTTNKFMEWKGTPPPTIANLTNTTNSTNSSNIIIPDVDLT